MATATKINKQTTTTVNMAPLLLILSRLKEDAGQSLGENEKLKGELNSKINRIIKGTDVTTTAENATELAEIISKSSELRNGSGVRVMAKRIELEAKKLIEQYPKEIEELKKEDFKENFNKELVEKNPNLNEDQIKNAGEYRDLVAKNSFKESIIDGQQNEALEKNSQLGPGKLENAWTDLKTTVDFLQKSPEEIKNIKEKYNSLKGKLDGVSLPSGSKEARSFERMMGVLNNPNADDLFSRTKKYLGWADRVDKLTGGWLNKTVTDAGVKVFEKIGNQAMQEFTTNALGQMAQHGFQQGFSNILNGVLSGGVQATATTTASGIGTGVAIGGTATATATATGVGTAAVGAAGTAGAAATGTAAVAGGAALSSTGVGAIVVAAIAVLGAAKKIGNTIAEKLGISSKKFLEEKFGKVGGFFVKTATMMVAIPAVLIGAISGVVFGPIIIAVVVGIIGYNIFTTNQMALSLVPPKGAISNTTIEIPIAAGGNINLPPVTGSVDGQKIVTMARSLIGNICYYFGGGHDRLVVGVDPRWGTQVGRDVKGRSIYGLDCSGFVAWVFHQYGILNTTATARDIIYSIPAAKRFTDPNLLQIGDIGYSNSPEHIGIYSGRNSEGKPLWIHSTSNPTNGGTGNNFCRKNSGEVYGGVHESTFSEFNIFARI